MSESENEPLKNLIYLIILIVLIWIVYWAAMAYFVENSEDRGLFGDMFGSLNTLFSGGALAGIIYAIWLQRKEIKKMHEQNELQLMPFVLLTIDQNGRIYLRNTGNGTAVNIKIKKADTGEIFIPASTSIGSTKLHPNILFKDESPHFCDMNQIMRREYLIEFENINRKRYFVRQEYKADENMRSMTTFEVLKFGLVEK